jgi:hypothetical protein
LLTHFHRRKRREQRTQKERAENIGGKGREQRCIGNSSVIKYRADTSEEDTIGCHFTIAAVMVRIRSKNI